MHTHTHASTHTRTHAHAHAHAHARRRRRRRTHVHAHARTCTHRADSVWSKTVLASYLYELMGQSNSYAGYVEAAQGIASLVVALPVGWLADRGSKSRIIAAGGVLLPVAVAATSFAVVYGVEHQDDQRSSFFMFVGALALWGAVQSIQNGPAQALYADSTAAGERSRYYMISYVLYLCASVLGPVDQHVDSAMQLRRGSLPWACGAGSPGCWLRFAHETSSGAAEGSRGGCGAAVWRGRSRRFCGSQRSQVLTISLFIAHGDTWDLVSLRNVFLVGMGLELFAGLAMLGFRDDCALEPVARALTSTAAGSTPAAGSTLAAAAPAAAASVGTDARAADDFVAPDPAGATAGATADAVGPASHSHVWLVPYILFSSSVLLGLASGMTIKFFPLFFKNECGMSPVAVQLIYAVLPLVLAAFSRLGTALAMRIGRVQTMVSLKVLGIGLLVTMALLVDWVKGGETGGGAAAQEGTLVEQELAGDGGSGGARWLRVGVIVVVYLIRTGVMNCTYPLNTSIMMDYCPKDQRARWTSLQSVVRFGWCGSAAAGGVLADAYGYSFTFLITAGVQAAATALLATLILLVPRAEGPPQHKADGDAGEGGGAEGDAAASAPPEVVVTPLCAPAVGLRAGGCGGSVQSEVIRQPEPRRG